MIFTLIQHSDVTDHGSDVTEHGSDATEHGSDVTEHDSKNSDLFEMSIEISMCY